MAKNRMTISFSGFDEIAEQLDKLGGDLKEVTSKALKETHQYVTPKVKAAFSKHDVKYTHQTASSIIELADIEWQGTIAEVGVGFKISNGGLASIFIMYGTPRMRPDRNLYNAIYGSKVKKEVAKLQQQIFEEAIVEAMK